MALPQAVARRAEAASALLREAETRRQPAAPSATPAPAATPASPAAADVATLQRQLTDTQEQLRKANARYDALQSKYDAEVPRAAADLRDAREKLKTANDRVTELEALLKRKVEAGEVTSLSKDEIDLMGPAMVAATSKIAREIIEASLDTRLKPINERFDQYERQSEAAYFATLNEGVPDFDVQNNDPAFIAWLNETDPVTQRIRFDLLKRADGARQGNRVVEIFRAFKEGREIGASSQPPPPNPLEHRQNPPEGGGGGQPDLKDDKGKKIWQRAEIKAFYDAKARGEYRGPEKQARAREIEQDIFAAQKEGRIRD